MLLVPKNSLKNLRFESYNGNMPDLPLNLNYQLFIPSSMNIKKAYTKKKDPESTNVISV